MLKGINAWIASEVFAKLLAKLDVPEMGGTTYLDNSLVYWGNELGFNHIAYSVPCLLAGSAAATSSRGATSITSTGTGARTSPRRTATSSRGSPTTSSW